jgi:large exoprotein involved in heme utilization and adhesion
MARSALGEGGGGSLTITATDVISISGRDLQGNESGLFSNTFGAGDAGRLIMSAPRLTMDEGLIQADAGEGSSGNAGDIEVRAGRLTLSGGAQISTSTRGSGRGGALTVVAADAFTIAGRDREDSRVPSGLFSDTEASGDAGNIVVEGGSLTLTDGAQISSSTFGEGRSGTITVAATDSISITGGASALFSNTANRGDAGRLSISTPRLTMDEGDIQTNAAPGSSGSAGSIDVRAGRLTLTGGAQISSGTFGEGRGGTVRVMATEALSIAGQDQEGFPSGLFSSTEGGGPGGDLHVTATHLQLSDGGTISARSAGAGDAGTIRIQAGETFRSQHGAVTTATEGGGGARSCCKLGGWSS